MNLSYFVCFNCAYNFKWMVKEATRQPCQNMFSLVQKAKDKEKWSIVWNMPTKLYSYQIKIHHHYTIIRSELKEQKVRENRRIYGINYVWSWWYLHLHRIWNSYRWKYKKNISYIVIVNFFIIICFRKKLKFLFILYIF